MLLLLKDLWTGDLPIGGESSVGRGRLKGLSATLHAPETKEIPHEGDWTFEANGENVQVAEAGGLDLSELENWVKAFKDEVTKAQVNHV